VLSAVYGLTAGVSNGLRSSLIIIVLIGAHLSGLIGPSFTTNNENGEIAFLGEARLVIFRTSLPTSIAASPSHPLMIYIKDIQWLLNRSSDGTNVLPLVSNKFIALLLIRNAVSSEKKQDNPNPSK
jgi:hypothetical protein